MDRTVLEIIRLKYQLSPAELARQIQVKDATVTRVLNGNRGIGTSLLKRTFKKFPDEVIEWLKSEG
jgi:plasmid maintenance system antidote protein VapI